MKQIIIKSFAVLLCTLFSFYANAQISEGGYPLSIGKAELPKEIVGVKLSPIDLEPYFNEDAMQEANGDKTLRFGAEVAVDFNLENSGSWIQLKNGDRLWRMSIKSSGAMSLNINFNWFRLPEGARFFAFNRDGSSILGAFTHKNHNPDGNFAIMPVAGDEIILELYEPKSGFGQSQVQIKSVIHGYRDFFGLLKGFGDAGACNVNINCPLGMDWQNQKRSVCMLLTANNSRFCTGALVNNTAQDSTPYILTANHCNATNNSIFMFNYESPNCTNIDGPTNNTVQGCQLRANRSGSDFALFELNQKPPDSYDVFYAGWSFEDLPPEFSVGIHHPRGDIKKISVDEDLAIQSTYGAPSALCWRVINWEQGTTEGGSSGSPLFNQEGKIIGQLYGGTASCNNINGHDNYGRFDISWNTGISPASRLKEWLDPINSGVTSIVGLGDILGLYTYDLRLRFIESPDGIYCNSDSITPLVTVRNLGTSIITSFRLDYEVNGSDIGFLNWTGTLIPNSNVQISLSSIPISLGNDQTFSITVTEPNGVEDENPENNSLSSIFSSKEGSSYQLTLITDNYADETAWELTDYYTNEILYSVPFETLMDATTYQETFCLTKGCYRFTIKDFYGDGICCGIFNGNGSYTLRDNAGEIIKQGGEFTFEESVVFCVDTVLNVQNLKDEPNDYILFPNPGHDIFYLAIKNNLTMNGTAEIFHISGKLMERKQILGNQIALDLSTYADGVYIVKVIDNNVSKTFKLIKNRQ
jgi:lysyl endopeptidase